MSTENGDSIPAINENAVSGDSNMKRPGAEKGVLREAAKNESESAELKEAGESGGGNDLAEKLKIRIRELEAENANLKDLYLRKAADFENFRKRANREREDSVKFGNSALLLDLIPTIDDFERAIKSAEGSRDFAAFHAGVVLVEKRMVEMLERKYGLKRFESAGEVFDPTRHEAVSVAEIMPPADSRVVVEDYQKGFMLHDRVLRTAKVVVSQEPSPSSIEQKAEGDGDSTSDEVTPEKEGEQ